jgi:hypothetical protein
MSRELDADIREVIDRSKVYDVLTRYCRALDRCDVELMRSVYWEDAVDDHGVYQGNAQEFAEFIIREIQNWFEVTMHAICNVHMELTETVACTESYLIAYHKVAGDKAKIERVQGPTYLASFDWDAIKDRHHVFLYGGRYVDRLEKRDGTWRIAHRRVVMDWNENWPGNSIFNEGMFSELQLRGTRGFEDPVFRNRP